MEISGDRSSSNRATCSRRARISETTSSSAASSLRPTNQAAMLAVTTPIIEMPTSISPNATIRPLAVTG